MQPVAPDGTLPVVLQVRDPVGRLHEWRTGAARRVGDADAVGGGAEVDALSERVRGSGGPRVRPCAIHGAFGEPALDDVRDDAEAEAVHRLDHALRAAVVSHGLPSVLDAAVERRGRDVAMAPDLIEQL